MSISEKRFHVSISNFQIFSRFIHKRSSFQLSILFPSSQSSSGRSSLANQMLRLLSKTLKTRDSCTDNWRWILWLKGELFCWHQNNILEKFTSVLLISSPKRLFPPATTTREPESKAQLCSLLTNIFDYSTCWWKCNFYLGVIMFGPLTQISLLQS